MEGDCSFGVALPHLSFLICPVVGHINIPLLPNSTLDDCLTPCVPLLSFLVAPLPWPASLLPVNNLQADDEPCFLKYTHTLCQESESVSAPSLTSLAWWRVRLLKTPPTCRVCRMVSLSFLCSLVHARTHVPTPSQKIGIYTQVVERRTTHCPVSFLSSPSYINLAREEVFSYLSFIQSAAPHTQ